MVKGSKVTNRQSLERVFQVTKRRPAQLTSPDPGPLAYLWATYVELHGPDPLSWAELAAWGALSGCILTSGEAKLLRRLDRLRFAAAKDE